METINKLEKFDFKKEKFESLTEISGIYVFFDINKQVLYIGKSRNLKARLLSYTAKTLIGKTKTLIEQTVFFSYIKVNSELEALLLEASLVRKIMPKFNIELKDDKSSLYIRITSEEYPRILTARKADEFIDNMFFIGPFPSSSTVKQMLRLTRKIFPFSQHTPTKKPCIYAQMGLCNPCPSLIDNIQDLDQKKLLQKEYMKQIQLIKSLFSGGLKKVYLEFEKQMEKYIKLEEFEKAKEVKERIDALTYVTQHINQPKEYLENPNLLYDLRDSETKLLLTLLQKFIPEFEKVDNIECYDIAHLSGTFPTASMVSFHKGSPNKKMYRRFRIQQKQGNNDVGSMTEVAKRRTYHFEGDKKVNWGKPDLMLIDGGKTQTHVFYEIMKPYKIPVIGLAKRFETFVIPYESENKLEFKEFRVPEGPAKNLVQRIRDEAHRFARRYHHHLVTKDLLK